MKYDSLLAVRTETNPGGLNEYIINKSKLEDTINYIKSDLKTCIGSECKVYIYDVRENYYGKLIAGALIELKKFEYKF